MGQGTWGGTRASAESPGSVQESVWKGTCEGFGAQQLGDVLTVGLSVSWGKGRQRIGHSRFSEGALTVM